jgi:sugar lactone lactonase YvrE
MLKYATLAVSLALAGCAQLEPLVGGMQRAENVVQTTGGRVFVSSDGGLYELRLTNGKWDKAALAREGEADGARCFFLGMAEHRATLYVAAQCPSMQRDGSAGVLLKLDLAHGAVLTEVGPMPDIAQPNGMAADDAGRLYLADHGATFAQGALYRVSLEDGRIGSLEKVAGTESTRPNGVRIAGGKLYLSVTPPAYLGQSRLLRYDLADGGLKNETELYRSRAFIDDFALVEGGLVVTRLLAGRVAHLSEDGTLLHQTCLAQPTSVAALHAPFPEGALLVTSRWHDGVHLLQPEWDVRPRPVPRN